MANNVSKLEEEVRSYGNPFDSRDHELVHFVSNDVMDDVAVKAVRSIEQLGYQKKNSFLLMLERNPSKFSQVESPSNFPQSSDKTKADGFRKRNEGSTASLLTTILQKLKFEMEIWTNFSNLKHCVTHRRFRSSVKYDQEINLT